MALGLNRYSSKEIATFLFYWNAPHNSDERKTFFFQFVVISIFTLDYLQ